MGKKTSTKKKRATKAAAPAKKQKEEDKIGIEAKQAEEEDDDAEPEDEDEGEEAEEEDDEEDAGAAPRKNKARRLQKAMEKDSDEEDAEPRGVIYIGHIPDGFFEPQMKKFFSQFGRVTRLRISRSKKRAASKGYGWVEFEEESVAKIVADTMHKYLMFGKQLVCNLVPKEKQWPGLFKGWKRRMANLQPARRKKEREFMNNRPTVVVDGETLPQVTIRQVERRKKSDKKLADLLKRLEVDYDISLVDPESEAHTSSLADPEGEGGVGQLLLDLSGAGGEAPKGGKKRKGAAAAPEATTAAEAPKPKVAKKKGRKAA